MPLNLEEYRQPWESDEHWCLRKEFIEVHENGFPKDRLLCLAQVYANIELLSCSYPAQVMHQVRELSRNLSGSKQLKDSNAKAQDSNKGQNSASQRDKEYTSRGNSSTKFSNKTSKVDKNQTSLPVQKINFVNSESKSSLKRSHFVSESSESPPKKVIKNMHELTLADSVCITSMAEEVRKQIVKQKMPVEALCNASQKANAVIRFDIEMEPVSVPHCPIFNCSFYINNILICSKANSRKKKARLEAAKSGVAALLDPSYFTLNSSEVDPVVEPETAQKTKKKKGKKKSTRNSAVEDSMHSLNSHKISGSLDKFQQSVETTPMSVDLPTQTTVANASSVNCTLHPSSTDAEEQRTFSFDPALKRNFVILQRDDVLQGPISILADSASLSHLIVSYNFENLQSAPDFAVRANVNLDGCLVGSGISAMKKDAKKEAAASAINFLKTKVYTIKIKNALTEGFIISYNQIFDSTGSSNAVSENNVGCKMLKNMGWTGGGIGKIGSSGIIEPINVDKKHKYGQGLGYTKSNYSRRDFISRAETLIQDYAKSNTSSELIFSEEFSSEERKEIHRIATKYHLKNNSYGKGESRHLVISRRFTAAELIAHLLQVGGSTYKYELIKP